MMSDCPICLNKMKDPDMTYPLLCPAECGYNFCAKCMERLIASSKCDYDVASDGNRHVKVRLACPQCRGDVSTTIQDSLLLRKALEAKQFERMPDSELNATELRIKHDFISQYADELGDAQARMNKFHNGGGATESLRIATSNDTLEDQYIDTNLFSGLEYAMTIEEQAFVTQLMTSGEEDQLAQAAQILHGIAQISLQGVTPSMRGAPSTNIASTTNRSRSSERRKLETLEQQKKLHPLPARMPRYALLTAYDAMAKSKTLKFEDDEWDGSLADAFSRVHQIKNNAGMDHILALADKDKINDAPKERVKILAVRGQAGRVGFQKGDVITHINGEAFEGNAADLTDMIQSLFWETPSDPIKFSIVVNAERPIAEVLKLRAKACKSAKVGRS